jgi:hypothetical protein
VSYVHGEDKGVRLPDTDGFVERTQGGSCGPFEAAGALYGGQHADVVGYAAIGGLREQARRTGGRPPSARLLCGDVDICLLRQ